MSRNAPKAFEFEEGGEIDHWDDVTCDRCGDLATRGYEGSEMLNFCDRCYADFKSWLR